MLVFTFLFLLSIAFAAQPFKQKLADIRRFSIHLTNSTTGDCAAHVEDTPWAIEDVKSFQARQGPDCVSYFTFSFEDINEGLELKTNCSFYLPRGSDASLIDGHYHFCDNYDVQFKYSGPILEVARWYEDPCLGPPPYDSAIAHGRANMTLTKTQAMDGVLATQSSAQMPISSLS